MSPAADRHLPRISGWAVRGFSVYAHRYVAKHFHAVRILRETRGAVDGLPAGTPVLVVMNHAAWWDPLTCIVLRASTPMRDGLAYAPIHAEMLERYGVFKRLGFFGVDPDSAAGGRSLLRVGAAALRSPGASVWVTAQGAFTDPRVRPVSLKPGLAHLCERERRRGGSSAVILPLAVEYPFWQEKTPELLVAFGEPRPLADGPGSPGGPGGPGGADAWQRWLEASLEAAMDRLAAAATTQDPARFDTLLGGAAGPGGVYGAWGRLKALLRGRPYRAEHAG